VYVRDASFDVCSRPGTRPVVFGPKLAEGEPVGVAELGTVRDAARRPRSSASIAAAMPVIPPPAIATSAERLPLGMREYIGGG
jgi:hypothetical protein